MGNSWRGEEERVFFDTSIISPSHVPPPPPSLSSLAYSPPSASGGRGLLPGGGEVGWEGTRAATCKPQSTRIESRGSFFLTAHTHPRPLPPNLPPFPPSSFNAFLSHFFFAKRKTHMQHPGDGLHHAPSPRTVLVLHSYLRGILLRLVLSRTEDVKRISHRILGRYETKSDIAKRGRIPRRQRISEGETLLRRWDGQGQSLDGQSRVYRRLHGGREVRDARIGPVDRGGRRARGGRRR